VNGLPQMIDAQHLPIILPEVEKYLPTEEGLPPLGNATVWAWNTETNQVVNTDLVDNKTIFPLELNTMPGWAGSSWYWMRYMDAHNENEFASKDALAYWESVDLYIGGSEHATGHLLYSRFWNKFLKDKGFAPTEEPFKKLINQGMILGTSAFIYRLEVKLAVDYSITEESKSLVLNNNLAAVFSATQEVRMSTRYFFSKTRMEEYKLKTFNDLPDEIKIFLTDIMEKHVEKSPEGSLDVLKYNRNIKISNISFSPIHVDVSLVNSSDELDLEKYEKISTRVINSGAIYIKDDSNKFIVGREVEKMSKSKYNVVTPDDICNEYGADTLRLYEMFLGPLEQAKPWNTAGISGVFGFLKKLCRLYFDENGLILTNDEPTKDNLKSLHKTIKKVAEDIEGFSFNTSVSQFMICVNELSTQNCHSRAILEPLAIVISPYAPHIAEELWSLLGNTGSIATVAFPVFEAKYLVESEKEYPVSFNGKMRFTMVLPLDLTKEQIEEIVMKDERTIKQLEGRTPNKVIIVPGKIINLVG
jgi:leucyl-tRNA synthetase